jgi:ABC-type uncharacterized transport system ATPase subunit
MNLRSDHPPTAAGAHHQVSLTVQPGEIHAVLGENGAGKSTLMKIIYGAVQARRGQRAVERPAGAHPQPARGAALGISMVFQHFSLFDTLTVAENVWLGLDKSHTLAEVTERIRQGGELRPGRSTPRARCTR